MKQSQTPSGFRVQAMPQPKHTTIPGLKVAYGSQAVRPQRLSNPSLVALSQVQATSGKSLGFLGKMKARLFNWSTEEAEMELPLGIQQLSQKTFLATPDGEPAGRCFRSGPAVQDYRYNYLLR